MKYLKYLALVCIVTNPQLSMAAEAAEHRYTPKSQITFKRPTMAAFDHSGKMITHSARADGSRVADHNGSMGNVTVARLGPDGKIETYCTSDADSARAWMAGEFGRRPIATFNSPVMEK